MFKESITKEELVELPLKWFEGEIIIVDDKKTLRQAEKILSKQTVIGFDTETKPAFKKGVFNHVALLQLSTKKQAFLIRLNQIGLSKKICDILANPDIVKPGVAIHDDIKGLQALRKFKPAGFVELQDSAKELGIQNFSLKKLTAIACGFRISKGAQLSNWEADEFTEKQQIYAATDAWTGLEIYEMFSKNI
ncbi:MAG: 3'-5' exonuclease domain-containing protein 2 [Bacteroidetes bacterium]|nr:3'-5' exonuclease domain-containing protein 2 [Bacteroidota bacterium]